MRHAPPTYTPDARFGDVLIEVKQGSQAAGWMRGAMLQLAAAIANEPELRALLVLVEPKMSEGRLGDEMDAMRRAIRPEIASRLFVTSIRDGMLAPLPLGLGVGIEEFVRAVALHEVSPPRTRSGGSWFTVLQVLVHQWLVGSEPTPIAMLMSTTGLSHPSISQALARLAHVVRRSSDRSVELVGFPHQEWSQLVASSESVRGTLRFADRSGKPRSVDALVRKLTSLGREDIAVGGILGATHHVPDLDIVGTPQLVLSIHVPRGVPDTGFVSRLDPALELTTRRDEAAALVIHVVRRARALFEHEGPGRSWADPSECLLDLQEARLQAQAQQFLHEIATRHGRRP